MSKSINKIILIGNVGKEPDIKASKTGDVIANFTVATGEEWKDKATGEKKDKTEWHKIVAFKKLAEIIRDYVKKGSRLYVEGKLRTRKYQDNSQVEKYITEIHAETVLLLDSRGEAKSTTNGNYMPPASELPTSDADFDDDIPF